MKFQHINLGQVVLKYQVPYDIFTAINLIYEKEFNNLPSANKTLIGKIQKESSLYYNGIDSDLMQKHNFLTHDILQWFENIYKHYLEFNYVKESKLQLQSIWIRATRPKNAYHTVSPDYTNLARDVGDCSRDSAADDAGYPCNIQSFLEPHLRPRYAHQAVPVGYQLS